VSPHGLTTGDLVFWNGNATATNNAMGNSASNFTRVTVTGASTFTVVTQTGLTVASAAGGLAYQVFNFSGQRHNAFVGVNTGVVILTNTSLSSRFKVDEFGLTAVVLQGGLFTPMYLGLAGQGHLSARTTSVGKLTAQIVSDGVTPSVMTCDRTMTNTRVDQSIQVIPIDAIGPTAFIDRAQCNYTPALVTAVSGVQVTAVIPAGTYPIGSVVGVDPVPMCVMGGTAANGNLALTSVIYATHRANGVRVSTAVNDLRYNLDPVSGVAQTERQAGDPDSSGQTLGEDFSMIESAPTVNGDRRRTLGGWRAAAPGNNDNDIMHLVGGDVVTHDWLHYASISHGSWKTMIGPGAS
jgi:hypothetical protein